LLSLTFRNRDFQWVTVEKSEKNFSARPFASGLHFPIFDALLFPSSTALGPEFDPAQTLSSISLFRKSNRGSYSAGCWSITLPARRCFPVAAALDAAIRVSALTPV
jgi:hypothetical protein